MKLTQLIYVSTPFGFDTPVLNGILASARRNNQRDGITGALICRADLYMQWLEGPRDVVTAALHRILDDDRHLDVRLVSCKDAATRMFPEWHMRDDPARSWMWSQGEVADDIVSRSSADDIRGVFTRLAADDDRA
jgi:hypothetical protein